MNHKTLTANQNPLQFKGPAHLKCKTPTSELTTIPYAGVDVNIIIVIVIAIGTTKPIRLQYIKHQLLSKKQQLNS